MSSLGSLRRPFLLLRFIAYPTGIRKPVPREWRDPYKYAGNNGKSDRYGIAVVFFRLLQFTIFFYSGFFAFTPGFGKPVPGQWRDSCRYVGNTVKSEGWGYYY